MTQPCSSRSPFANLKTANAAKASTRTTGTAPRNIDRLAPTKSPTPFAPGDERDYVEMVPPMGELPGRRHYGDRAAGPKRAAAGCKSPQMRMPHLVYSSKNNRLCRKS